MFPDLSRLLKSKVTESWHPCLLCIPNVMQACSLQPPSQVAPALETWYNLYTVQFTQFTFFRDGFQGCSSTCSDKCIKCHNHCYNQDAEQATPKSSPVLFYIHFSAPDLVTTDLTLGSPLFCSSFPVF